MSFDNTSKSYLLLHENRKGTSVLLFTSKRDLERMKLLGLTLAEEMDGDHRDLCRFLNIRVEDSDYLIIQEYAAVYKGEW